MRYHEILVETVVIRPVGWQAANDVPASWTRPGHLYRGMSAAEYAATVGAGKGVQSDERYCATGEGTCFSDDAASAESYANFGRSDPRKTGLDTYLVEIDAENAGIDRDADGYWKSHRVPQERIRRVWRMNDEHGAVVAALIHH